MREPDIERDVKERSWESLPAVMTAAQLQKFLHIGKQAAYELCHRADFKAARIIGAKSIRISRDELRRWFERQ
jgi:hypothetical protein